MVQDVPSPKKLTVLVVDDELFVRLMAVDAIEDAGHATIEAADADEAISLLEQRSDVDVVFTDIKMPGSMDGLGLASTIHGRWPTLPVILTSGHMAIEDLAAGTPFLQKPYRTSMLTDRLNALAQ